MTIVTVLATVRFKFALPTFGGTYLLTTGSAYHDASR